MKIHPVPSACGRMKKGTPGGRFFFFLPPDAPCCFFQVSGLFRTGGPYTYPFRYRVVKYYPVAQPAVHIHRLFRHHETGAFLDLCRIEYHAGNEAVREAGATRIVPYRESVSVIRDEHVPVLWPVFVPGDTQPVSCVQAQFPAQYPAQVHAAVTAYRDDPFAFVGQCRMGIALVINCQFHNHQYFIVIPCCPLFLSCRLSGHDQSSSGDELPVCPDGFHHRLRPACHHRGLLAHVPGYGAE